MMNYDKSYFFVRKKEEELMESVGERRDKTCENPHLQVFVLLLSSKYCKNHHLQVFVLLLSSKYLFSCKNK